MTRNHAGLADNRYEPSLLEVFLQWRRPFSVYGRSPHSKEATNPNIPVEPDVNSVLPEPQERLADPEAIVHLQN